MNNISKIKIEYDLNGGKIPFIDDPDLKKKHMPFFFSNFDIYFNSHLLINNNHYIRYKLTDDFELKEKKGSAHRAFKISFLNNLVDQNIVINDNIQIPFHVCLIQNKFNIIKKLYQNITSKYINIIKPGLINQTELDLIKETFKKVFILHRDTSDFISIASKPNILHKFAFANKFRELLNIIFKYDIDVTDDILSCEILKCFNSPQAYNNLSDIVEMTKEYANLTTNKEQMESGLEKMSRRYEDFLIRDVDYKPINSYLQKDIEEIKNLIKFNRLLKRLEDNNLFLGLNIGLAELFYCCYIGVRLYNPKLSIGHLSNKILPINQYNLLSNILNKSYDELRDISVVNKETNISYIVFKYNDQLPNYHSYGSTTLKSRDVSFPDCVENTLLQLIKTHCWNSDSKKFDPDYLPINSNPKLIEFINGLTIDNDNAVEIKSAFGEIVSNIPSLIHIYKNRWGYEIVSDIENFISITNYLFGIESNTETFSSKLFESRKNPNIIQIILNGNTVEYKFRNGGVNFFINKGHSSHSITQPTNDFYDNYNYINLIKFLTSNYSFISSIKLNIYKFISGLNRDKKQIVNINELLLDSNIYFLNNVIEDPQNSFDITDILYLNKKFFDHLKLLSIEDFDQVLLKSKFIIDTLHTFGSHYLNLLPNTISELKKDKHAKYIEYMQIILECLSRNPDFLTKPYYFPQQLGIPSLEYTDLKSKRNLLFALITNYYYSPYDPVQINKLKTFILDPIFNIIKQDNLVISNILLTPSTNCNNLLDLIHDPKIATYFGDYFNSKYDNNLFRCIEINKFFDVSNNVSMTY